MTSDDSPVRLKSFLNSGFLKMELLFCDVAGEVVFSKSLELNRPIDEVKAEFYKYVTRAGKKGSRPGQDEIKDFLISLDFAWKKYQQFLEAISPVFKPLVPGLR